MKTIRRPVPPCKCSAYPFPHRPHSGACGRLAELRAEEDDLLASLPPSRARAHLEHAYGPEALVGR